MEEQKVEREEDKETSAGSFVHMKKHITLCKKSQDEIITMLQDIIDNTHEEDYLLLIFEWRRKKLKTTM